MKNFLVSVDTEGDNLWRWHYGDPITTENTNYIMRFQELCEKYGFIPTYLTNYEMAADDKFVKLFRKKAQQGKCEIGMHLHAWNSPPEYKLDNIYGGQPFITEYPKEIIFEKHKFLKNYLENRFELPVITYRSGRWATNDILFKVLEEIGIKVDCSVTPGIDHSHNKGMSVSGGNNYKKFSNKPYMLRDDLIEIPMTTTLKRVFGGSSLKNKLRNSIKGKSLWLRPAVLNFRELSEFLKFNECSGNDYAQFMIHSSELMPNGSPYFKNEDAIEQLYLTTEKFFEFVSKNYKAISIGNYGIQLIDKLSK